MEKLQLNKINAVCFRQWTRKSYAVFNSLGRTIRIGVLSLSYSILVLPGYTQEQPDSSRTTATESELELSEVVVSAQRAPVVQSQLMRVVQVITRAEIEQASATDVAGLLEHLRGVDIRQRGPFGMQADVSIRGGNFDQTLILINGVNISDPQTGHHNLNLPVDLSSVQRIEVLQGPGARIFGPNAFNGVINIITGEPAQRELNVSVSGGQYGFARASASLAAGTGKIHHFVGFNVTQSDGYIRNTDFKNANLYYRGFIPVGNASFDLQGGYTVRAFGANSFYTPKYPDQFEQTRSEFLALKFLPSGKINLKPVIYWRRHHDRFELFRSEAPSWYSGHNYHMTDVAGASLNWLKTGQTGKTSVGLDYRFEHIFSNVLGNELAAPLAVPGEPGAQFTRSYQRESLGLMAEQAYYLQKFSVSAGMLVHFNQSIPGGVSLYPGIDLGYQVNTHVRWYATGNRTLRLPTFTDLFYSGPTNIGNPDLKPEEAISLETGLKGMVNRLHFELAVFRRWGRNMIDWAKFPGDEKWRSLNLTEVNISGVELGIELPFGRNTAVSNIAQRFRIDYTWLESDKKSDGFTSLYVLDNLRHKLDFSLNHRVTHHSGFELKASWQDRAGGYLPFDNGAFVEEVSYKPVWLVSAKVFYNLKQFQIYIDGSNVLNSEVFDHANVPQPGRWMVAGVKYKLAF